MEYEKNDIIKKAFQEKAVIHRNIWMYSIQTAIELIRFCKENDINIHGMEAFRLFSHGIQPSQANSKWFKIKIGNWDESIEFIQKCENAEYLYEIWYDGY